MKRDLSGISALARLLQTASVRHLLNGDVEKSVICDARAELALKHVQRGLGFRPIATGAAS